MCVGKVGIAAHRVMEAGQCFRQPSLLREHDAEVIVDVGKVRIKSQGRSQTVAGKVVLTTLIILRGSRKQLRFIRQGDSSARSADLFKIGPKGLVPLPSLSGRPGED